MNGDDFNKILLPRIEKAKKEYFESIFPSNESQEMIEKVQDYNIKIDRFFIDIKDLIDDIQNTNNQINIKEKEKEHKEEEITKTDDDIAETKLQITIVNNLIKEKEELINDTNNEIKQCKKELSSAEDSLQRESYDFAKQLYELKEKA